MKKFIKYFFALMTFCALFAVTLPFNTVVAANEAYYSSVDTSTPQKLLSSLSSIVSSGTKVISYDGLKDAYRTTDCKPNTNIIWDMYSNENYVCGGPKECANYKVEGDSYNREHTTPQSWFGKKSPMVSDLFNVYPTDGKVNGMRSNYPYGEVGSATYTSKNGSKKGSSSFPGYSGTVFEPIDEYKGDFARTYFFMATRYMNQVGTWGGEGAAVYSGTFPYLSNYAVALFTKWSYNDPVSEKEIARNDAVYALQKNRNPYIDHPEFMNIIYGGGYNPAGLTVDQEKVDNVISLINALPATITIANQTQVTAANTAYNSLNSKEKALVTNVATLNAAVTTINGLVTPVDPIDPVDPIVGGTTFDFGKITGLSSSYSSNVTGKIDGKSFTFTNGYSGGSADIRLGSNAVVTLPAKYNPMGLSNADGSALSLDFDVENASAINFKTGLKYGTVSKWNLLFSTNGGTSYKSIATGTDVSAISGKLDTPQTGRFALVITGTKPRLVLTSVTIGTEEPITKPQLSAVTTNANLNVKYQTVLGNTNAEDITTITGVDMNLSASCIDNYEKCGFLVIKASDFAGDVAGFYDGETLDEFADFLDAEYLPANVTNKIASATFTPESYDMQYIVVFVVEADGYLYFANEASYSVTWMVNYYLTNNLIADDFQKAALELILN